MRKILTLSMTVLAFAACGKSDEKKITVKEADGSTATASVSTDDSKMTITADNGKVTIAQNGTAQFNPAAPQYPGAKITSTMISNNDGKVGGMVAMETTDAPATVMAFYKAKLLAAKRQIAMETNTPEGGMIMSGNDADGLVIAVGKTDGKTTVSIITGKGY
jgi:hypothetical protein